MCLDSRCLSGNGPHLAWRGEPPVLSRVEAGALDLGRGTQGPLWWPQERQTHASCSVDSRDSSPVDAVAKALCGVGSGTLGFLSSADMDLGVLLESPQGSQSSSRGEACMCAFLPSCSSSVALPFPRIKGSVAFTRGFPTSLPTGLSHVPQW